MIRPLVIDEAAREKARRVVEFASKEKNWYRIEGDDTIARVPGDIPEHTCLLNTYRCVFSYTKVPEGLFRHLSISVPGENYPNPAAVQLIAELFGFSSNLDDWDGLNVSKEEHCIIAVQRMHG